jgi:osmotically-inducible protein OsmY
VGDEDDLVARRVPSFWHALCETHRMTRIPSAAMACAILASVALAGCNRPYEEVSTPAAENLARNVSASPQPPASPDPKAAASPPRALPAPETFSDAMIAAKIRASLASDAGMNGADVSVNTDHGVVVLAGTVKSYEQVGIASAYAQRQDGVMRVDNQLTLGLQ